MQRTYGSLTEAAIGVLMRDVVSRLADHVQRKRFSFKAKHKGIKDDGKIDWVTDIDVQVQGVMKRLLLERFPTFGIIAEEGGLSIPAKKPTETLRFTGDPIDGTRAFVHYHSGGISVMLALMDGDHVIAVCIEDVMTKEVYYFRPGSKKTHHLSPNNKPRLLNKIPRNLPLIDQYVLIRDPVEEHDEVTRRLLQLRPHPLFKKHHTAEGSIGLSMARLWKGEVGAAILRPGKQTPWDTCPVIGLANRLGFRFLAITPVSLSDSTPALIFQTMKTVQHTYRTGTDMLVIHENHLPELAAWCASEGLRIES